MSEENIKIVEDFLNSLKRNELSREVVADDVRFREPMMGEGQGADALTAIMSGFYLAMHGLRIKQHIAEGDYVVTHWEVYGIFGTIPVLEKFRIRDGKIVEFEAFYDPRPIVG